MPNDSYHSDLTRRDFMRMTAAGMAASAVPGCSNLAGGLGRTGFGTGKRPNVFVIFDDQLRAEACSLYGGKNITTPNLEHMASQGTTFNNATSICPLCTPFRGMMQTGRYPSHSGLVLNWVEANPNQRCVAHVFKDAGYQTGFIGKWHLAAGMRKKNGMHSATAEDAAHIKQAQKAYRLENPETEYVPPGAQRLGYDHWQAYNFHCAFNDYWYYEDTNERLRTPGFETDILTDQAMAFMREQQKTDQPFFLMMAPHPPHPPFGKKWCPPGYLDKIPETLHFSDNVPADHKYRKDPKKPRCYYAMSKNMDDNLGRLLKFLDESGLSDDTILVFTSDHGEMLGSQGRINKMVPYAEAVNTPLVIRWPGHVRADVRTDVLHSPIDHMPTLCGLAGLTTPDTADGMDMSPVLLSGKKVDRDAILMANYVSHWDYCDSGTIWPEWRGVRTERYTYAQWLTGEEELYDNLEDPCQMRNLAKGGQHLPMMQKMRSRLKDFLADAHDRFMPGTGYADWYDDERNLIRTG